MPTNAFMDLPQYVISVGLADTLQQRTREGPPVQLIVYHTVPIRLSFQLLGCHVVRWKLFGELILDDEIHPYRCFRRDGTNDISGGIDAFLFPYILLMLILKSNFKDIIHLCWLVKLIKYVILRTL